MAKFSLESPKSGSKISINHEKGKLKVPDNPIIPFIEGDGIGVEITEAMRRIIDAAVEKAYNGRRKISWYEIYAGEKANNLYGEWLPQETLDTIVDYVVAIKGPLTTPIGGGMRSLNVALRRKLDLFACIRPVQWITGTPAPVKKPRENAYDYFQRKYRGCIFGYRMESRVR